jgi:mitotic spindle assembly checkpoint protein MAD2
VLAYTDKDIQVPAEWADSDAKMIVNPGIVPLRSFTTLNHKVQTMVSYSLEN